MNVYKDQALFVAVDRHGSAFVLEASGEKARELHDNSGIEPYELGFDEDDHPRTPGVHVWEGDLAIDSSKDDEGIKSVDFEWEGTWRPATVADFDRFGLAVPVAG